MKPGPLKFRLKLINYFSELPDSETVPGSIA